jgi:hypothetical protein
MLIHWFFEYRHNNIYHNTFYIFISLLFSDREDVIIKAILGDFNLIERMIDVYMDKNGDYDNKGHILDICNLIRLTSKCVSENSFLCVHLNDHQQWNSFQEIMIRDTLSEINSSKNVDVQLGSECEKRNFLILLDAEEKFGLVKEDSVDYLCKNSTKYTCDEDLSVFEFK